MYGFHSFKTINFARETTKSFPLVIKLFCQHNALVNGLQKYLQPLETSCPPKLRCWQTVGFILITIFGKGKRKKLGALAYKEMNCLIHRFIHFTTASITFIRLR